MRNSTLLHLFGAASLAAMPVAAHAEPGDSHSEAGSAAAEVIDPARLYRLQDLRFGAFAQPTAAATLTIAPNGAATATGEVATTMTMAQPSTGRGQATFRIDGTARRAVVVLLPNNITISNGAATMQVGNITSNMPNNGRPRLNSDGVYYLNIGGTLNVNAMQAPGTYSGDFTVRVIFQ